MFGGLKRGFRSLASPILVVNVVGELQPKRTLAASRGFLAAARLSCHYKTHHRREGSSRLPSLLASGDVIPQAPAVFGNLRSVKWSRKLPNKEARRTFGRIHGRFVSSSVRPPNVSPPGAWVLTGNAEYVQGTRRLGAN